AGGTQRLPKLIGIAAALDLILTGKQLNGKRAKAVGLVDVVCPTPLLRQAALEAAHRLVKRAVAHIPSPLAAASAWFKGLPGHVNRKALTEFALEDNPIGRKVLFDQALKQLRSKTGGHYPAPEKALEAVRIGAAHGFADDGPGYTAEAAGFGELLMSPQSKQLIHIFFATTALKKDNGCDDPLVQARPVNQITMLGAGLMGAGIAYVSANAGLHVRLKDRDAASVGKGLAYARQILDERVRKRRSTPRDRSDIMARISPTTDYAGLRDSQVIIEAVFEDIDLKHRIVREVESACSPTAIFASNTSTIPLTTIARASARPGQVIGMHYFSPVQKMPLLEIIVTERTEPWVVATCVELGKRQGKTVIVVNDGVGFYTSRILGPYMNEAFHVLSQGVAVAAIDKALTEFGYPVGPVKLLDEVGIDVAYKAAAVVQAAFGDRLDSPPGIEALMADNRQGRKNRRGFYLYPSDPTTERSGARKGDTGGREVDDSVYKILGITSTTTMPAEQIATRCWLQMVNEAAHCFGEGVLRSARDGDIGAIFGLGFPPFRGGPFHFADSYGISALVAELQRHQQLYGKRFAPAPVLLDMAAHNQTFYPSSGDAAPNLAQPGHHGTPPLG
ncbi:MAG: fatty acid oxidation complex subunit alpha FadJ, partial [Kofleriaceae bacterium]|nr:fatty acid oxidation complex subunit alpha FadJ [Kofleriaceae bacterium]